jgi:hypothetical protein
MVHLFYIPPATTALLFFLLFGCVPCRTTVPCGKAVSLEKGKFPMPSNLRIFQQRLLEARSLSLVKFALSVFPWSRHSQDSPPWEARRTLEWQRVDALLESLRRL